MSILLVIFFLLATGCGEDSKDSKDPPAPPPPKDGDIDISAFNRDVKPVLDEHCALSGCHAGQQFLQDAVSFKNSNGPRRVINNSMPPSYSPKFGQWELSDKRAILNWYDDNM